MIIIVIKLMPRDICAVDIQRVGHDGAEHDGLPAGVQVAHHASRRAGNGDCTERAAVADHSGTVLPAACLGHGPLLPGGIDQPGR